MIKTCLDCNSQFKVPFMTEKKDGETHIRSSQKGKSIYDY